MPSRLLSLLSSVETALVEQGCSSVNIPPQRAVNFQKQMARMSFHDKSGSLTLQNFSLADGQICVRAQYTWTPSKVTGSHSIYPSGGTYDWAGAAAKIADGWVDGLAAAVEQAERSGRRSLETQSGLERLAVAS